jgi:SAM-dependent methyltransferase
VSSTADTPAVARAAFPDWIFAPNIGGHPDIYEIENRALDPGGHVLAAMCRLAPWDGRTLVDLGCGTGFWLPGYARDAARVIGIEPDPALRARAAERTQDLPAVEVMPGSAEHLPLADRSVDVVHARFAYFLAPGSHGAGGKRGTGGGDAGLAEVLRVLAPGGSLIIVDNDYRWGQFAEILTAAARVSPQRTADDVDAWWRERGATRHEVRSRWSFASRADLAAVLGIEVPAAVARTWLARHPTATSLSCGYVLFRLRLPRAERV